MADLKQLFHSPEELSNEELVLIKRKVMLMNQTPYYGMLFGLPKVTYPRAAQRETIQTRL